MNKIVSNIGINDYPNCEQHIQSLWRGILKRCYSKTSLINNPSYSGCSVDPKWHKLSDFRIWMLQSNWKEGLQLDKDILVKGNKIYGPDTCRFVSFRINNLFTYTKPNSYYLQGVTYHKQRGAFQATCRVDGKLIFLGRFLTEVEAFDAYKIKKESVIKMIAKEEYLIGNCTKDIYDAMMNWTI